jgi:hypothetical protein
MKNDVGFARQLRRAFKNLRQFIHTSLLPKACHVAWMFILWRFQQLGSHNHSGSGKPDLTQEGQIVLLVRTLVRCNS